MKLKFLFLGMVAAALMIGCNNEVLDNGSGDPNNGNLPTEGLPVYASVYFSIFNGNGPNTRAGESVVGASGDEKKIGDAGMYIYKFDGVSTSPQAYVYVTSVADTITMKATSGVKKIFVATNIAQGTARLVPTPSTASAFSIIYDDLNNPLYANSSTTWDLLPSTTIATNIYKADGLIRGLAMLDIYGDQNGSYSGSLTQNMLMSNWDGPDDVTLPLPSISTFESNCVFKLFADIDSTTSRFPPSGALKPTRDSINNFDISVQRAFAKVSVGISAGVPTTIPSLDTVGNFSATFYEAGDATYAGLFQPWGVKQTPTALDASPIWILGNIHKETLPFQKYVSGAIRDLNYLKTDDSIPLGKIWAPSFDVWTTRYDNTRIFPFSATINSYPNTALTVDTVKKQMLIAGNNQFLTTGGPSGVTYFAYAIENARMNPVTHDYGTYIVIGGRYNPESVITDITRAALPTNPPTITTATAYSRQIVNSDTLYYIPAELKFILGKNNLLAYYAWYKGNQPSADPTGAAGGTVIPFDQTLIIDPVNLLLEENKIMQYAGGQCYYRVFIGDLKASAAEMRALRRNHIYAINITKIVGPGIDDPNDILIPGKPIDDLDTYVTARINILDWHQVDQVAQVDMN